MEDRIIIIGAGAAGLMATLELSAAGQSAIVLEAAGAPGGRIRTLHGHSLHGSASREEAWGEGSRGDAFSRPVEEGAEFVHGHLPLTLHLLKEAGIPFHPVGGKMIRVKKGKWDGQDFWHGEWELLMRRMKEQQEDLPLAEFLTTFFGDEKYAGLRNSAERYANGFDLADARTASTHALYEEWNGEDGDQYRIEGGYDRLIGYLADQCRAKGAVLHFSSPVGTIEWEPGRVRVSTTDGNIFTGSKVIVTVSAGVMQSSASGERQGGEIRFSPAIPGHMRAFGQLGFGTVIKILMEFREPFWKSRQQKLGFIVSDEDVPTWWTQMPDEYPLLTGWLPGAVSKAMGDPGEEELTRRSLLSLAAVFSMDLAELKEQLVAVQITDWSAEPFVRGGYSFDTVNSAAARQVLQMPVADTIYFAGEAIHEGIAPATVEAALASGQETAKKIAAQS